MKARKITNLTKVKALMEEGKSAKEISKEVGISISNTYNYMTRVRKLKGDENPTRKYKARKKLTSVNKKERTEDYHKYINGAHVLFSKNVETLQAEVIKLNDWCVQWRAKVRNAENVENLENELRALTAQYADKCAVIEYLEKKLGL